ncbi:mandelate racemase/muconate lactonizing enzyme family protein [Candidatus Latescibacterota bacterium]
MVNRREFFHKAGIAFGSIPFWMGILPENLVAKIPSNVEITDVKTFIVEHLVFVKIYTNVGVTGLGEASITNGGLERAVEGAIQDRAHILIGRDPTDIEFLWQALFRWPRTRGGTLDVSAISGIDIALWDILGKLLDVPVYQLMGGKARTRSRMYAHCNSASTPEQMREMLPPLLDEGFKVIRMGPNWGNFRTFTRPHNLSEAVALTEAMREIVGENIDIIVDAHGYLTTNMAMEYAKAVEPYRLLFLEDPVVQENMSGLKYIQEHTTTPLHIGESNSSKFGFFKEIIFNRLASGVRPDVVHAGGLTESKKICAMAEANFMDVSLHAGYSSVADFAATHLALTAPNCIVQELASRRKTGNSAWLLDLFNGDDITIIDGYAQVPEKPGLGCDLNEEVAAQHPHVGGQSQPHTIYEDGSVSDW